MAELGSKGVTAGKIAINVQKKLTRAQEKVKGEGVPPAPWDAGSDAGTAAETSPPGSWQLLSLRI